MRFEAVSPQLGHSAGYASPAPPCTSVIRCGWSASALDERCGSKMGWDLILLSLSPWWCRVDKYRPAVHRRCIEGWDNARRHPYATAPASTHDATGRHYKCPCLPTPPGGSPSPLPRQRRPLGPASAGGWVRGVGRPAGGGGRVPLVTRPHAPASPRLLFPLGRPTFH